MNAQRPKVENFTIKYWAVTNEDCSESSFCCKDLFEQGKNRGAPNDLEECIFIYLVITHQVPVFAI